MSRFVGETDSGFKGRALVVEVSENYDRDGAVAGYTTGDEALANAEEVARRMTRTGQQPPEHIARGLLYTPRGNWRPA